MVEKWTALWWHLVEIWWLDKIPQGYKTDTCKRLNQLAGCAYTLRMVFCKRPRKKVHLPKCHVPYDCEHLTGNFDW